MKNNYVEENSYGSSLIAQIKAPYRGMRDFINEYRAATSKNKHHLQSNHKRIYHYHIQKTAGTSLNAAFWSLAGLDMSSMARSLYKFKDGYVFVLNSQRAIEKGNYFFASSHTAAHKLNLPPNTFTVTVLRAPIDRVLSFYRYMRFFYENPSSRSIDPFWKESYREAQYYFRDSTSFQDFLSRIPPARLSSQLYMFSSEYNVDEALERISDCSAVLFTENLSEGVDSLSKALGLSLVLAQERRFNKKLDLGITSEQMDFLTEALADEVKFYERAKFMFSI